ncbi:hypothetical protein Pla100_49930 [Neorhodopirellula pilleata]|uniref:Uncharacterized protein n=1 Tax=Neorhodopirellula pilleata TaxID=2714738 RepID=A0A5C5ZVL8_9BACT|nr:hypothetical protein Pla100_49930 [Neorhodopirellula pilleata]
MSTCGVQKGWKPMPLVVHSIFTVSATWLDGPPSRITVGTTVPRFKPTFILNIDEALASITTILVIETIASNALIFLTKMAVQPNGRFLTFSNARRRPILAVVNRRVFYGMDFRCRTGDWLSTSGPVSNNHS